MEEKQKAKRAGRNKALSREVMLQLTRLFAARLTLLASMMTTTS